MRAAVQPHVLRQLNHCRHSATIFARDRSPGADLAFDLTLPARPSSGRRLGLR
jgi:hypothetical protein